MADVSSLLGFDPRLPAHQNALDLFPGSWVSKFPPCSGLTGGEAAHFDDGRVTWAASELGGMNGLSILELGPFEGYNTYQFQSFGASSVVAVESSHVNFLKCLVVKNIFGLNSTFLLGDCQQYLANTRTKFDVCWASGILYHMIEPVKLLQGIRRVADTAFIWTQYYDEEKLSAKGGMGSFDASRDKTIAFEGRQMRLRHRNYPHSGMVFSGGQDSFSYWMVRDDIMFVLDRLGYRNITIGVDNPDHIHGPAMFFLARTE